MLFINAILSKNQLYKYKNQINKVPTISKQDNIELFCKYICTSFYHMILLMSVVYLRVIITVGFDLQIPGDYVEE